jgi:hypothetical protein
MYKKIKQVSQGTFYDTWILKCYLHLSLLSEIQQNQPFCPSVIFKEEGEEEEKKKVFLKTMIRLMLVEQWTAIKLSSHPLIQS